MSDPLPPARARNYDVDFAYYPGSNDMPGVVPVHVRSVRVLAYTAEDALFQARLQTPRIDGSQAYPRSVRPCDY